MSRNSFKDKKDLKRKELAGQVRNLKVDELYQEFVKENIYHAFIVFENGKFTLSHPKVLAPVQAFFELSQDFANHEGVFIGREEGLPTLFFAFIHDTRRGLAQGGLRFSEYKNTAELLVDGLRLSQGMTRKNALAGLWWGGGKGIMSFPFDTSKDLIKPGSELRRKLFEGYGKFIASLGGVYYTAEDVGTNTDDMKAVLSNNRFTTCIPQTTGGSGNPSPFTARGVLRAMQAAWKVITGTDNLHNVKISVQGAGNVGGPLIRYLYEAGAKIWFCDMSTERIEQLQNEMPGLEAVPAETIFDLDVDIFAPCAIGAQVNAQTIPRLKVKLVCGAANNILRETEADARRLEERGIAFVPDFVCNRMGIINCADEWQGYLSQDIRVAAEKVYPDTLRVFKYAKNKLTTTMQAAKDLADIAASELHPLILHRGRRIIDNLINSGWHKLKENNIGELKAKELAFVPMLDETEIRVGWEREGHFRGKEFSIAASPVSAAHYPDLSSFLSPLLMDIKARSVELLTGKRPKRVLGSNHGGLSLQISVEQMIPYEREEIGYHRFIELCQDIHRGNDEEIRKQLHKSGIGFDQQNWLDPLGEKGREIVEKLYNFLDSSKLIMRKKRLLYYCSNHKTVLVSSDVIRDRINVEHKYTLKFSNTSGDIIETQVFFPEYVLGSVALAVKSSGKYAGITDTKIFNPSTGKTIPLIFSDKIKAEAEFITPIHNYDDELIALANGIKEIPQIFDDEGKISAEGYYGLSREEARQKVLEKFGENKVVHKGSWTATVARSKNSGNLVVPKYSEQILVRLEEGKALFNEAVKSGKIKFSNKAWKDLVLKYVNESESWCISRQYWWGNIIPDANGNKEVFSTWFSLVAMSLKGAGWPDNPKPNSIDEVFVDPDFLLRWVVPSQIISLLVTGRPVFSQVNVHGSLHVVERVLKQIDEVDPNNLDEERFLYRTIKRPMQKRLGNVIEPDTLIRRFGADSLRLSLLLSLKEGHYQDVTASQDHFDLAVKSINRMVNKVTNIVNVLKRQTTPSEKSQRDLLILETIDNISRLASDTYQENRFSDLGELILKAINDFVAYCNEIAKEFHETGSSGKATEVIPEIIAKLKVFTPVCPYIFEKLDKWVKSQAVFQNN